MEKQIRLTRRQTAAKDSQRAPFQGRFSVSRLPIITNILCAFGIIFCYVVSMATGDEPPFPASTITRTSNHFPQFVVFRICEEGSALAFMLIWWIEYNWLLEKAEELKAPLFFPSLQLLLGVVSNVLFIGSTATIDTGKMNGELHGFCAVYFFFLTFVNMVLNFYSHYQLRHSSKDARTKGNLNDTSYYLKLLVILFLIVLISLNEQDTIPNINVIAEYLAVVAIIIYTLTFAIDWIGYSIKFSVNNGSLIKFTRDLDTPLAINHNYIAAQTYTIPTQPLLAQNFPLYIHK